LFNKADNIKAQSYYTADDLKVLENIGKLVGEILKAKKSFSFLLKQNRKLIKLVEEQGNTWKLANWIIRREATYKKLIGILEGQPKLNEKILEMVGKVMDCEYCSLFLYSHGSCKEIMHCGIGENPDRVMKIIEYSCRSHKMLNIKDLSAEPLIDSDMNSDFNCSLIVPFTIGQSTDYGILFCMRQKKEFVKIDEEFAQNIAEELSQYPILEEKKSRFTIELINVDNELSNLLKYSLPETCTFDFYNLFYEIKVKLGLMFNLSSCTIYVANQNKDQLLTLPSQHRNTHWPDIRVRGNHSFAQSSVLHVKRP